MTKPFWQLMKTMKQDRQTGFVSSKQNVTRNTCWFLFLLLHVRFVMYASKGKEGYWNIFFSVNFYLQDYIAVFDGFFFFENVMLRLTMHFV